MGNPVLEAFNLAGRTVIVTGASRGIGEAIARTLAAAGAELVLAARKPEALQALAAQLTAEGARVLAVPCHTGKEEDVQALVERTVAHFGKADAVVNNAATNPYFGPMIDVEWGAWEKTFEVNVRGYFAVARALAKHLLGRQARGSIVNVTSVLGMRAAPLQGVYGMTKAAVISMTQTLAAEWGGSGIRVNAIAPGLVDTKFAAAIVHSEGLREQVLSRTPLGRIGAPGDIAGAALYLVSEASAYVNGATLVIDGGWTVTA